MHTWFLRIWIPLFCILLAETFYCCSPVEAKEPVLLTRDGIRISYGNVHKSPYTLLYLIKPWDGFTVKIMEDLKKYERDFYGRVKPVVILSNTRRAVANSYMDSLNLKNTPFILTIHFPYASFSNHLQFPVSYLSLQTEKKFFEQQLPLKSSLKTCHPWLVTPSPD